MQVSHNSSNQEKANQFDFMLGYTNARIERLQKRIANEDGILSSEDVAQWQCVLKEVVLFRDLLINA